MRKNDLSLHRLMQSHHDARRRKFAAIRQANLALAHAGQPDATLVGDDDALRMDAIERDARRAVQQLIERLTRR